MPKSSKTPQPLAPLTKRSRGWLYAALLVIVWLASLLDWSTRGRDADNAVALLATPPAKALAAAAKPEQAHHVSKSAPAADGVNFTPTIHAVRLDKESVCRGELNFVNVQATGPDGSDAHLRVSLTGAAGTGSRIPFRLFEALTPDELPKVKVEGRGGSQTEVALPPLHVKNCDEPRVAEIDANVVGTSLSEWQFTTRVSRGDFAAVSYGWDFGDGTHETTREPTVAHSYHYRTQDKRYSSFVVTVTLRDAEGGTLKSARAVGLVNPAFGMLHRHNQVAVLSRRFEESDGERIELYHAHHAPVRLDKVSVHIRPNEGPAQPVGEYAASEVLGVEYLLPSERKLLAPDLSKLALPESRPLLLVYELTGASSDGFPLVGTFSLLVR